MWQRVCAWQGGKCAGERATEVGGTHPTGMHPCSFSFLFHQWQGIHLGLRLISNKYIQTFSVNLSIKTYARCNLEVP